MYSPSVNVAVQRSKTREDTTRLLDPVFRCRGEEGQRIVCQLSSLTVAVSIYIYIYCDISGHIATKVASRSHFVFRSAAKTVTPCNSSAGCQPSSMVTSCTVSSFLSAAFYFIFLLLKRARFTCFVGCAKPATDPYKYVCLLRISFPFDPFSFLFFFSFCVVMLFFFFVIFFFFLVL